MPLKLIPPSNRSRNWRVRGTDSRTGRRIDTTTHTRVKRDAETFFQKLNRDLFDGLIGKQNHTFGEAALAYVDGVKPTGPQLVAIIGRVRRDGTRSPCLMTDFGDWLVQDIDQQALKEVEKKRFQVSRYGEEYAPSTIVRFLIEPLTAVLNYAAEQGWRDVPHFRHPKFNDKRKRWATEDEVNRLINLTAPHIRPLILFLVLEGCRQREALSLDWVDVWLDRAWAVLRNTKRDGEDRGIALHPQVVEMSRPFRIAPARCFSPTRASHTRPLRSPMTAAARSRRRLMVLAAEQISKTSGHMISDIPARHGCS